MPRKKTAQDEGSRATTWNELREERGQPPSLRVRERGKCYDCGEVLVVGSCGGWHTRKEIGRGGNFVVEFCCACCHG